MAGLDPATHPPRVCVAKRRNERMSEVLFYHLERRTLDDVLPGLVEKTLDRGWRALIRTESADRAQAIDNLLWTYSEESFLPHAQAGDGDPKRQPVLVTVEEGNANDANVLFLVGGAAPPAWSSDEASALARIVLMFDGRDTEAVSGARAAWRAAKEASHEVTYWKESPSGKWEKQG
jgi:DNA polymerase-3 subunit chi